jgi:hypothetical protein
MAKVVIDNAEVTKYLGSKGFVAEVKYRTRNGEDKVEKWAVWGKQPELGTVVTITGDLTIKLEEFEGESGLIRYARGHVNNPVLSFDFPSREVVREVTATQASTLLSEEAPF